MTEQYISIADAIQQAKKSDATIRRMIKELTPKDKERFTKTIKGKIFVSKAFLGIEEQEATETKETPKSEDITFLKGQIEIKDRQIDSLNERLRETNILLRNEQDNVTNLVTRLQLSEAKQDNDQPQQSDEKQSYNAYFVPILCIIIVLIVCVIVYQSMSK